MQALRWLTDEANRAEVRCFLRAVIRRPSARGLSYFSLLPSTCADALAALEKDLIAAEAKADKDSKADWKGETRDMEAVTKKMIGKLADSFDSWIVNAASSSGLSGFPLPPGVTVISTVALFHVSVEKMWRCDWDSR